MHGTGKTLILVRALAALPAGRGILFLTKYTINPYPGIMYTNVQRNVFLAELYLDRCKLVLMLSETGRGTTSEMSYSEDISIDFFLKRSVVMDRISQTRE